MDGEEWRRWLADRKERGTPGTFRLGFVAPQVAAALKGRNIGLQAAAITISKPRVGHIRRAVKGQRGARLDDADFDRLPAIIARPRAVLLDTAQGGNCLIYVFDPLVPQGGRDRGKVVVRMNYSDDQRIAKEKRRTISNSVRTAGYLSIGNLRDARYVLLGGELE